MFSHIVIFWTDSNIEEAPAKLLAGINQYLKPIPGSIFFHAGLMVSSPRSLVEQSYQIALNIVFQTKEEQDAYQTHPLHLEFLEKAFKPLCKKVVVYDFA
jgi:hypothetical protein